MGEDLQHYMSLQLTTVCFPHDTTCTMSCILAASTSLLVTLTSHFVGEERRKREQERGILHRLTGLELIIIMSNNAQV